MKRIASGMAALALASSLQAQGTRIAVRDDVLQKDVTPLGINISQAGGGAPWDVRTDKAYFCENFEGTVYRQAHLGTLSEDGFVTAYVKEETVRKWWGKLHMEPVLRGATATLISGPAKGERRIIQDLAYADHTPYQGAKTEPFMKFIFDRPVALPDGKPVEGAGILLEKDNSRTEGCTGQTVGYWMSGNTELVHDDLFPGGFGFSALLLDGAREHSPGKPGAFYMRGVGNSRHVDFNGRWIVKVKAKALDADATLTLEDKGTAKAFKPIAVPVTGEWQEFTLTPEVSGKAMSETHPETMYLQLTARGGRVIVDDYVCHKDVAYENPTIFNDEFVNALKALRPGIIRQLMMGGTMEERLSPWIESVRSVNSIVSPAGPVSGRTSISWSLPDIYNLAEHLGTEVWCSIPGTLYPEEVDLFMEYIGGPAGTKGGDMRIRHGHPEPYTRTLKKIHVEIGNEAWNTMFGFLAGGYNGPDYWEGLFARMKASPHYAGNVVLHAAGQNYSPGMTKRILADTPSADEYAIAPYQIHHSNQEDVGIYETDEDFVRFCSIYPMRSVEMLMPKQMEAMRPFGKRFSIYEVSWHMTGGDVSPNTPDDKLAHPGVRRLVNRFVASTPAATAHFNHMLRLVRDCGMRSLCHFTFSGDYFNVKLWGSVLNMAKGRERYRPMGLALGLINEAMSGDMITTEQAGAQPMLTAKGGWPGNPKVEIPGRNGKHAEITEASMPAIHSYAFRDGNRRSLILFNFDLEKAHPVALTLPGEAKDAVRRQIAPKNWWDSNEYDLDGGENSVAIETGRLSGDEVRSLILPPASLVTLSWED